MHTTAYGRRWNRAPALPPVGIGASSARENAKCIRILADFRRNRPPMKLIRLCPSSSPADARAVFAPGNDSLAPPDGLSRFGADSRHQSRAMAQGPPGIRFPGSDGGRNKKPSEICIVRGADASGGPFGNAFDIRRPTARPPRSNWTTGNCQPPIDGWNHPPRIRTDDRQSKPFFTLLSHYSVRMHFVCSRMQSVCTFCPRAKSQ